MSLVMQCIIQIGSSDRKIYNIVKARSINVDQANKESLQQSTTEETER